MSGLERIPRARVPVRARIGPGQNDETPGTSCPRSAFPLQSESRFVTGGSVPPKSGTAVRQASKRLSTKLWTKLGISRPDLLTTGPRTVDNRWPVGDTEGGPPTRAVDDLRRYTDVMWMKKNP